MNVEYYAEASKSARMVAPSHDDPPGAIAEPDATAEIVEAVLNQASPVEEVIADATSPMPTASPVVTTGSRTRLARLETDQGVGAAMDRCLITEGQSTRPACNTHRGCRSLHPIESQVRGAVRGWVHLPAMNETGMRLPER